MSELVPAAIRAAAGDVSQATRALLHAVRELDPAAIDRAIEERAGAVAALRCRLHDDDTLAEPARDELLAALALEASEADSLLREVLDEGRNLLTRVRTGRRAMRGYAEAAGSRGEPVGLDRAG